MRRQGFFARATTNIGCAARRYFLPLFLSLLIAVPLPSLAQTADQLQQVQQLMQQRQGGASTINAALDLPQNTVLQPAESDNPAVPLPPSRLEQIMAQRAGARLRQFGYNQLGSGRSVIVPQTGAVQDDYILGPSDEVVVSLRGQETGELRVFVDRNGQVLLPRLNPIAASGRSFGSFRQDVEAAVHRAYVATSAFVSIGRVRQISVSVSGEVNNPGQRLMTGLSSTMDALLLSGGVKKTGSLRSVRLQRGGHEYTIDLYTVLTNHGGTVNMRLADGDRIVVPLLGRTVAVTGLVRRAGIYELPAGASGMSARALMSLAGGQEVRGRYRLSVLRIQPDGRSAMVPLSADADPINDSEILFVQLGADQTISSATLSGGTSLAGAYPIVSGTKLSDVLKAPGAMGDSPYTPFGIIVRKDPVTLMRSLIAFSPVAVLAGREDQALTGDDLIRVFSVSEVQMLNFIVRSYTERLATQQNAIRNPLAQALETDSNSNVVKNVTSQSGVNEEIEDVGSVPASVQRQQVVALLDVAAPGTILAQRQAWQASLDNQNMQFSQRQSASQGGGNPQATQINQQPNAAQRPDARDQFAGQSAQNGLPQNLPSQDFASQNSQSQSPSQMRSQNPDFQDQESGVNATPDFGPSRSLTDQSVSPGGFASDREVQTFGQLARQINIDPLILMNFLVDRRVRLDGAVRGPDYYFVGPNVTLDELVSAAGGTVNWADDSGVELITTAVDSMTGRAVTQRRTLPFHQGLLASYIVQPRDRFRFSQVFSSVGIGSVTVQGQVRIPGTFPIIRGEHLSDLMARAGGLTDVAYPYGTVFLRQSAAQIEKEGYTRAANEVQDQLVVAMTRVGNDKLDPNTFAAMQGFVSELRNQRALGRISVIADPSVLASKPELDPLLESGDVIFIPQRPSTVSVLGQVMHSGSYPYRPNMTFEQYVEMSGGYSSTADQSQAFIVLPDGSARKVENSWLNVSDTSLPPGSSIVVPRDVTPFDLRQTIIDVSQIFSQFAVSIASVAVLSKQ